MQLAPRLDFFLKSGYFGKYLKNDYFRILIEKKWLFKKNLEIAKGNRHLRGLDRKCREKQVQTTTSLKKLLRKPSNIKLDGKKSLVQ